jgi:hypothetical protein
MIKAWICHYMLDGVLCVERYETHKEAHKRAVIVDGAVDYDPSMIV